MIITYIVMLVHIHRNNDIFIPLLLVKNTLTILYKIFLHLYFCFKESESS